MNGARERPQSPFGGGPLEQTWAGQFAVAHGILPASVGGPGPRSDRSVPSSLQHVRLWYAASSSSDVRLGSALASTCSAASRSVGTYVFGDAAYGVAHPGDLRAVRSVLVATRYHTRAGPAIAAVASQSVLIVLNLVLGFSGFFNVDNFAHIGGLLAASGGTADRPAQVPTLASLWQTPAAAAARQRGQGVGLRLVGVLALVRSGAGVVSNEQVAGGPVLRYFYGVRRTTERAVAAITQLRRA